MKSVIDLPDIFYDSLRLFTAASSTDIDFIEQVMEWDNWSFVFSLIFTNSIELWIRIGITN